MMPVLKVKKNGVWVTQTVDSEVFIAEYDITSFQDLLSAYRYGKTCYMRKDDITSIVTRVLSDKIESYYIDSWNVINKISCDATNGWSYGVVTLEMSNNKTINITSESTDTQYPSAKAVYNLVSNTPKTFIVTFTNSDNVTYSANKTYAEVVSAIESGDFVVAQYSSNNDVYIYPVVAYSENTVFFQGDYLGQTSVYFRLNSDNSVVFVDLSYCNLPTVSLDDVGKVLSVNSEGRWVATEPTEIEIEPVATSVASVMDSANSVVTITTNYNDGSESVSVITLDDSGNPISVTTDGVTCSMAWEGFDA